MKLQLLYSWQCFASPFLLVLDILVCVCVVVFHCTVFWWLVMLSIFHMPIGHVDDCFFIEVLILRSLWILKSLESFPCVSADKEPTGNVGDLSLIPGLGRFPWRRERLPTPVFWPWEFYGLYKGSLAGYSSWSREESDTTEQLTFFSSSWKK